jgi:dienelactone hydrolase
MMATVVLFHHAQGQTRGFLAFADELRAAGHTVHAPDLFEGRTFATVEDGVAHAQAVGFEHIIQRGVDAATALPAGVVYAGFSLGILPAEKLAITKPGARGALLFHGCAPPSMLGGAWPPGVPVQIHLMREDAWADEDRPAAEALVKGAPDAVQFDYPGKGHLFADASSPDYDAPAAQLLMERVEAFLRRVG